MAIFQTQTTSFREELLKGVHDLLVDTLKIALYKDSADLGADTTIYSVVNEITGTGYVAGGKTLTNVTINKSDNIVYVDFDDVTWNPATFTAAGALIYNSSKANRSIAVLSFGSNKTAASTFTIQMPTNTANSAILRFN